MTTFSEKLPTKIQRRSNSAASSFGTRRFLDLTKQSNPVGEINFEQCDSQDSVNANPPSERVLSRKTSSVARVSEAESTYQIPEIIIERLDQNHVDEQEKTMFISKTHESEKKISEPITLTTSVLSIPTLRNTLRKSFLTPAYSIGGSMLSVVKESRSSISNSSEQPKIDIHLLEHSEFSVWTDVSISYEVQLSVAFSAIISVRNIVDIFLELVTFKSNHSAMKFLALQDKTMKFLRQYYLKTNFFIDFLTVIPFELIPIANSEYFWIIRLLKVHKLYRTVTTSPIYKKIRLQMQTIFKIGHSSSLVFPLSFIFLVFLHTEACIIFLGGRLNGYSNSDISCVENANFWEKYTWSLHKATANIFPSGYAPSNPREEIIVLVFAILGAVLYACIVGAVSSIAIGYDASGRLFKQKVDELKEYMSWKNLDATTQRKVFKYFDLKYREKYFDEFSQLALLNEMNESLRNEIAAQNCRELISKVPFLRRNEKDGRDELFLGRISSALEPCYYIAGDVLFVQGEFGEDM
ncbi:anaphase-promoting complex subunit Hcn1, partial [Physocladia obscura]